MSRTNGNTLVMMRCFPCCTVFQSRAFQVHVVWSEHSRPYKRETIATKFCDVLIVLEKAGDKIFRVRVDTTSSLEFGPLYDGALVGSAELAEMVRLTVVGAKVWKIFQNI